MTNNVLIPQWAQVPVSRGWKLCEPDYAEFFFETIQRGLKNGETVVIFEDGSLALAIDGQQQKREPFGDYPFGVEADVLLSVGLADLYAKSEDGWAE